MTTQKITICTSNRRESPDMVLPTGLVATDHRTVEAEVHGDWAVHNQYGANEGEWSVTHVPSGLAVAHPPNRLEALAAAQALQGTTLTATYDGENGLDWPNRAAETAAIKAVLQQFDWFVPASERVP